MFGLEWMKRLVARKPAPAIVLGARSKKALSHITIHKDGHKEEFVCGTVRYKDGCDPVDGHKTITIIDVR